jgi:hypothetical protein
MKSILSSIAIIQFLFIMSCNSVQAQFLKGDGNVTNSERKILNFSYIEIEDGIDLYLSQSSSVELSIEADQNLHEYIVTKVEGDVLKIYLSKNIWKSKSLKVHLKVVDIKGLEASGGSDVESSGSLKLNDFSAICSGGSDIRLDVDANELKFKASGGSDGFIKGKVNVFKGMASGGSDIKAFDLKSNDCFVEVNGGSDAEIYVNGKLLARGSGGSDVSYKGNPTNIDSNMSGGSDLIHQ